jgi:putative FmdB family regulatory protein
MPVYCFKCACGKTLELIRPIALRNDPARCPDCRRKMQRDLQGEVVASTDQEYLTPILSDAMGVHPSQVAEAQKLHPDIRYKPDGRVEIRSHAEHKRVMKALGFFDRRGYS